MDNSSIKSVFERNSGIFRLIPVFVPRPFSSAGRQLRLHPDDYNALGTVRGAYLTYEPRWNSDVNVVYENITAGEVNPCDIPSAAGRETVGKLY